MTAQELVQLNGESNFEDEVLKAEGPTLVDFYADWCGPCRVVGPIIESLSKEYSGRARFVKVNVDEHQSLAATYDVQSIPTVVVFSHGREVGKVVGVVPPKVYRDEIDKAISSSASGSRE